MIINLAKIRFGGTGGGTSPAKPEDSFQETYTANGNYDVTPQAGHVFSGGQVEVDVHPTDKLTRTYTENNTYEISGEWTGAEITVNVQPRLQTKEATPLTLAQTVSPDAGYDGLQSVTVTGVTSEIDSNITADNIKKDVTILGVTGTLESGIIPTGTININANGTYDVTDKATAVVAVGGTDYRYKTGTPDVIGLAAIGWTTDDIGYYGANSPHYVWENDNYKVSQKNIDLYSLDDPKPSLYKDDPDVTFVPNKNMSTYFYGNNRFINMKYIRSIPMYDTSKVTNMGSMFEGCTNLEAIPLLNTSNVTKMYSMFKNCSSLTSVPPLDTSNVTGMSSMFSGCTSLKTIPLLNTSNVTYMNEMFRDCSMLTSIPLLNTSKVTTMEMMFSESSIKTIPLLNTSNVTNMEKMFAECVSLTHLPVLDTSHVTSMSQMFWGCSSLETIPLLNTSKVTNMSGMFQNCRKLKTIPPLDTSNVTSMRDMFAECVSLTHLPVLDTSHVTSMSGFINYFSERPNFKSVDGIDFSSVTSQPSNFFSYYDHPNLTHFIVNGKINFSWNDTYGLQHLINLDYESVKSILEAMNRTDNTNAKTMKLNCVAVDRNGELAALVASCATKGWTIQGLNIKERSVINSITPNIDHIVVSDIKGMHEAGLSFTIDTNDALQGGGYPNERTDANDAYCQFDYYDATTDEKLRDGNTYTNSCYVPPSTSGTSEVKFYISSSSSKPAPRSGEYALVGITFKSASTPYEFVDYYFKVYPDGE